MDLDGFQARRRQRQLLQGDPLAVLELSAEVGGPAGGRRAHWVNGGMVTDGGGHLK